MMREERILMMNDVELECSRYICVYLSYPHFLANPPFLVFFQIGPYRYLIVFCYTCILLFPLNTYHSSLPGPDIQYATFYLSRYQNDPGTTDFSTALVSSPPRCIQAIYKFLYKKLLIMNQCLLSGPASRFCLILSITNVCSLHGVTVIIMQLSLQ